MRWFVPVRNRQLMTYNEYMVEIFSKYFPWLSSSYRVKEKIVATHKNPFIVCFSLEGYILRVYTLKWVLGEVWKCMTIIDLRGVGHSIRIYHDSFPSAARFHSLLSVSHKKKIRSCKRLRVY
jgi:hypothetical protein